MKKVLSLAIAAAVVTGAFAAPKPSTAEKTPKTIACAVTGGSVNIAEATKKHMYSDYKGRRYFFCCNGCPQSFAKEPGKYSKKPSIPTPKHK
jgi:YHS domain-containing protein